MVIKATIIAADPELQKRVATLNEEYNRKVQELLHEQGKMIRESFENLERKEGVKSMSALEGEMNDADGSSSVIPTPTSRRERNLKKEISIAVIEKRRNLKEAHKSEALNLFGKVRNKTCILIDDIITSGGTLIHAAEFCLKKGAKRVLACVVHHDFSRNAIVKLNQSPIEKIFMTNTIALQPGQKFPKLVEISVAPLIAEELKSI